MKAKYLFTAFLASVALLSSCEKELDHYLDEIQVSSSYVAINVDGGSTTIDPTVVRSIVEIGRAACRERV